MQHIAESREQILSLELSIAKKIMTSCLFLLGGLSEILLH